MRLITSVFLLSLCLLPAVFGDAIPEVQSGEEGINDGIIDADGGGEVISAEDFLQQAYRVEELQTEYHNDYKLVRFNLVNMQGENVAWCPTAVLKTDSQWHLCLLYINGPDYVQRGEAVVFDAILPPDIENGPMTLRLRVITDIRGDAYNAIGDVTVECRRNKCMSTPEQQENNILRWEGPARPYEIQEIFTTLESDSQETPII